MKCLSLARSVVQEFSTIFFKVSLFIQGLSLLFPKMFSCGCGVAWLISTSLCVNPESCSNVDPLQFTTVFCCDDANSSWKFLLLTIG